MTRKSSLFAAATVVTIGVVLALSTAGASGDPPPRGDVVVFVTSQGLYYDSIVNGPLPPQGPFQLLEMGPNGLQTEFGPDDPGYRGGRWKMDSDGDGEIDTYLLLPVAAAGPREPVTRSA